MKKAKTAAVTFNILIKEERGTYEAHCLELDIVVTANSLSQAKHDIIDLIQAQLSFAFSNDNLDHLYRPAPPEVWEEFYRCEKQEQERHRIGKSEREGLQGFVPPWIIANLCRSLKACHA